MKSYVNYLFAVLMAVAATGCAKSQESPTEELGPEAFVRVEGEYLIEPNGDTLFIQGTNLGNWLNPEGYMFGLRRTNSPRMINDMICQMVGPDEARAFWQQFKDNYITRKDVEFIAQQGANTIRLPFHYKLFTNEDYMGMNNQQEGFARIDSVVEWCHDNNLYLILDMHDAPGGQTGDNIDDSYGYPWLLESEPSQQQFCDIWQQIAEHYANEPVILGYELINEPIAPYFENMDDLNAKLEPLHKKAVAAIREKDKNHIILLGGAQWNGNFEPFTDWGYDDKIMYTCHRYGSEPTKEAIQNIIDFRDKSGLPMYMGEIGHNTDEWQETFCRTMIDNNIGYTFWPYKKIHGSSMVGVNPPEQWGEVIIKFSEAPRGSYQEIRDARPDQTLAKQLLWAYLDSCQLQNCTPQQGYINSLLFNKK